jgi:hypothetical protein
MTCPNCTSTWYHEHADDIGRITGYCEQCSFEKEPPRIGGRKPAKDLRLPQEAGAPPMRKAG